MLKDGKRKIVVVDGNTDLGRKLIEKAYIYDGYFLHQVYDKFSKNKQIAYDEVYEMYLAENGEGFSIISHNNYMFCVSWVTEEGVRIITPHTSYLVKC